LTSWNAKDAEYWLGKEDEIAQSLVDLNSYGFVIQSNSFSKGWTDDPRIFARVGAAEALASARDALPDGMFPGRG